MMGGMTDTTASADVRPLSELLLAGIGWATLGVEAADELADDLARRVGVERDEMRSAVRDTIRSWRADAERVGTRRDEAFERVLQKSGLARREEVDDLALRIAQLEHRLRLLERATDAASSPPAA
jgi:polyhydroxyalkanoate synthesis regulator phasin